MSDLRSFLQENRDRTAEELADVSDKLAETAWGRKRAKLQAQLAFWDEQLGKLPPVPKSEPEATRAAARKEDDLDPPDFLRRSA